MAESPPSKKRSRAKNFTATESEIVMSGVSDKFEILNAKHCSGGSVVTKKMQDQIWDEICNKVNSAGVARRSTQDCKEKWRAMVKKAKTEVTAQKISMGKTGGGPPVPLADAVLEEIASLYKSSAKFHGILGAGDSETQFLVNIPAASSSVTVLNPTEPVSDESEVYVEPYINIQTVENASEVFGACSGSKASFITVNVTEPETCSSTSSTSSTEKSSNNLTRRPQRSLKDVQLDFYEAALENEKEKAKLFKQLNEAVPKLSVVLDLMCDKFSPTSKEE